MIVELLGNTAGWLTLGAGMAAGADVILIPEIPYDMDIVIEAIEARKSKGRNFSLIAVAERARSKELVDFMEAAARRKAGNAEEKEKELERIENNYSGQTMLLARRLEDATRLETRITILGSLVRGGTPTAMDRLLATQLAEWSASMVEKGRFGRMACRLNGAMNSVPLSEVAFKGKPIPPNHGWIRGALQVGTCLGVDPGQSCLQNRTWKTKFDENKPGNWLIFSNSPYGFAGHTLSLRPLSSNDPTMYAQPVLSIHQDNSI